MVSVKHIWIKLNSPIPKELMLTKLPGPSWVRLSGKCLRTLLLLWNAASLGTPMDSVLSSHHPSLSLMSKPQVLRTLSPAKLPPVPSSLNLGGGEEGGGVRKEPEA